MITGVSRCWSRFSGCRGIGLITTKARSAIFSPQFAVSNACTSKHNKSDRRLGLQTAERKFPANGVPSMLMYSEDDDTVNKIRLESVKNALDRAKSGATRSLEHIEVLNSMDIDNKEMNPAPLWRGLLTHRMKPFPTPLNTKRNQIRILELLTAPGSVDMKGTFHHVSLSEADPYTALSYEWGPPGGNFIIDIDGMQIEIRHNLYLYFQEHIKTSMERRFFWIDAICIDQANVVERNHQVSLMKHIYKNAQSVDVWLGPASEDSGKAMEFLALTAPERPRPGGESTGTSPWAEDEGQAAVKLFERSYWSRMWVIQEIVHARDLTVVCGSERSGWHHFVAILHKLKQLQLNGGIKDYPCAQTLLDTPGCSVIWQRAHWNHPNTPSPTLRSLIETFFHGQCSDKRDAIYALLSLADPGTALELDYKKSPMEIFHEIRDLINSRHPGWTSSASAEGADKTFLKLLALILKLPYRMKEVTRRGTDQMI